MTPPKKIILISLDTLRADHLGCYGYSRNTSPTLDALAHQGILFKNAFSPSSFTIPAHASIFTGKYPSHHSIGFNQVTGKLNPDIDITLAESLKSQNFSTAAFVSSIVLRTETNLGLGFDTYDDDQSSHELNRPEISKRDCTHTTQNVINWLDTNFQKDFFVFIHYMDIHGAYDSPVPFCKLFVNDDAFGESKIINAIVPNERPLQGIPEYQILNANRNIDGKIISFENDVRYYIAQYDGCIRYLDDNLGLLLEKLRQLGIYDETLIIITADHGEAFGENDIYFYHGLTVTHEQIHVPLIIKPHKEWPVKTGIIDAPVSTLDIMPTLLELCDSVLDDPDIQGHSLIQIIENRSDPVLQDRVIMSENERQYALIYPNHVMELFKKETPFSTHYPAIPELIDALNGKKMYWDSGNECLYSLPFDQYQRYKIVSDIINKFRTHGEKFKILEVGAGFEENLKKFLPNDGIYYIDKAYPPEYSQKGNFIVGDITKTEFDQKFDFVVAIDVYEHIPQPDRKKFIDTIITQSKIATIIAAPFNEGDITKCEIFANEVYKLSHGSDYVWLKEHIANGLPSLSFTIDLIRNHHLNFVQIPNGYLPRWFEMISTFLLTENKPEFSAMMSKLYEFYNETYYQYDNRDPAYRQVLIILKNDPAPDFSDILSQNIQPDTLMGKDLILASFIEKIKRMYQINDNNLEQIMTKRDQQFLELSTQISRINQQITDHDKRVAGISNQSDTITTSIHENGRQINDLSQHAQNLQAIITGRDSEVKDLTQQVVNLQNIVAERDSQLSKKEFMENPIILDLTAKVQSLEHELNAKEHQILDQNNQIQTVTYENREIQKSIVYQLTTKFHRIFIEKGLPHNTRRRKYYDLGLKGGRILVNEGFGKLCLHYTERRRVKAIERELKRNAQDKKNQYGMKSFSDASVDQIKFQKSSGKIEVSIVIPVHNKLQYTLNCLKSISEKTTGSFEIVIVDDASTDETESQLKNIANLSVIKNKENLGFVESCNKGAKLSTGKYLLFLNNDTLVTDNWLIPLLDLIKKDDVGAVGVKLIYPDGTLQEAGGIIWNDASGWNYGRGDNPDKSHYNFVRDVDYCSGAALIVKKDVFNQLGGFDTRFKPGYYEDTDLCFSIRNIGYRVLYQPQSVVIHFEGISNGTDISTGIKKYQEINRTKFFEKWETIHTDQHFESRSDNVFDARIRRNGKKILVIDHYVPTYDRDSGSYRMYNLLKLLVELDHKVTFIGDNLSKIEPYTTNLQQKGIEVIYSPTAQSIDEYLKRYGSFFDIVFLSRSHIAIKNYPIVKKNCVHAKIIFDTVDLQYLREQRRAELENDALIMKESENSKITELYLATNCDLTLVVSPKEKEYLLQEVPQLHVEVLSNIHEVTKCDTPFKKRNDLMFLGGFDHHPNIDAMQWFVKEIFPQIIQNVPDIKLYIIGSNPTEAIENLASKNVIVVGYCEDLTSYFSNCRVFVAPLRYGAGVKGKINQSMSYGLPVVTTPIGAEGMNLVERIDVLIAESPELFAKKVMTLYTDEELWNVLSKNSIINVERNFSFEVTKKQIQKIIELL